MKTITRYFIDLLLDEEILKLYKHFSGVTQVKFKNRQDAEQRLINISHGKLYPAMLAAFTKCDVSKETIKQWGGMMRGPIAFPQGEMKPEDLKKHAKAISAKPSGDKQLRDVAALVLLELRDMIPVDATGEAASVSSTEVAARLNTNVNSVCRASEQLEKRKLIALEDDSNLEHQFYWLTLLPSGRELAVERPAVKLPASSPGPRTSNGGKYIFRLVKTNPRREGTWGWKSFNLIKDGMSYEEYKKAGGRNNDLAWDVAHKFVELRSTTDVLTEQVNVLDKEIIKDLPAKTPIKKKPVAVTAKAKTAKAKKKGGKR